jgi:hypothetical protein
MGMFMNPKKMPMSAPPKPGSRATVPGTQPQMGKTRPQAAAVSKAPPPNSSFAGARRVAKAAAGKIGKEVVPRAPIVTRAKPSTKDF